MSYRVGDPCGYARTLVAVTTECLPTGALRPGLGLFATRWTLADRVAGLIDPGRISMTRTSFPLKVALAVALVATGLCATFDPIRGLGSGRRNRRLCRPSRGATSQAISNADSWTVEGIVVDERGPAGRRSDRPHDAGD